MLGNQRAKMYKCEATVQGKLLTPTHIGHTAWRHFSKHLVEGLAF